MPSITKLRSALGDFANDKNDEQLLQLAATARGVSPGRIAQEYGYKPTSSGIAGLRTGAAVDRYQAGLYGLGEAVTGADFFRRRREANEFESNVALDRARDQGAIGSFDEVQGLSDVPSYVGGLAIGSAPYMLEALGGGLAARGLMTGTRAALGTATAAGDAVAAGRAARTLRAGQTAGGMAATYPSSVGEILQAQREQSGEADLGSAAALGVPFAAFNALGIGGALARQQMLRSGIGALDNMQGFSGGLARAGATGLRTAGVESGTETLQEMTSQIGRMAVDPDEAFLSDAALGRYKESAIAGAFLGGTLGGATGFGRSEGYQPPMAESDLTQPLDTTTRPDPSQFVTQDQTVGLKKFIDETTGVVRPSRKDYEKQFEAAFNEPSGQFASDPATGIERELTVGELMQRGDTAMDLTGKNPADTAAAGTAATKVATTRDPRDVFLRDELKVIPNNNSRQLFTLMEEQGVDPTSPAMVPVWNYAAAKYMTPSRLTKATELMDAAIIQSRKEAPIGTGISTVQQPTGSVGVGSPVVQGGVGDAGRVDLTAGAVDGGAPAVGAPLQQAGVPAVTAGESATTVATDAPTAAISPRLAPGQFRRAPRPMTVLESARATPTPPMAAAVAEPAAPDIIGQIFGEQDADIIRGVFQGRSSTELAAEAKANGIKGRSEQMIRNKIAGEMAVRNEWPKKIAAAKQKFGYTDQQIQQALEAAMAPDADTRSEVEREMNLGRADLYGVRMSETEAIEAGLEGSAKSAGGGQSAVKGFTKLQKDIDAMYKRLETEKDPMVLAYVTNRLTELQAKVEAFEDREQARIRAAAGLTDADGEVDLVAAAQQAEQKPSSISDADAAKEAEAAKFRAERATKLQADRNGLAVGDTVKNPKLGTGVVKSFAGDGDATTVTVDFQSGQTKELSVKLAKLEKTDAVQAVDAATRSGTFTFKHASDDATKTKFDSDFSGQRYDGDGGTFGSAVVYLDNTGQWTNEGNSLFYAPNVYDVQAEFKKAFVLSPETAGSLVEFLKGKTPPSTSPGGVPIWGGNDLVSALKKEGYDAIVVEGFDGDGLSPSVKNSKYSKKELDVREALLKARVSLDVTQPQVLAFDPKGLKVLKKVRGKKPAAESKGVASGFRAPTRQEKSSHDAFSVLDFGGRSYLFSRIGRDVLITSPSSTTIEFVLRNDGDRRNNTLSSNTPRPDFIPAKLFDAMNALTTSVTAANNYADRIAARDAGMDAVEAQVPATPTQVLTEAEQAAQAWDVVAADFPEAPKFADLTKAQQNTFIEFGPDNWKRGDVETELTKLARAAAPTQRIEYPTTAGQENAPAYLVPAQRAVVDFMNGDITREDLQQKFADLNMTTGQQRSVTNRIEWFPADLDAVKSLIAEGPALRALRTVTTVDEDNASVELQEQELSRLEAVPGVGLATDRLRSEGLSNLVDYVGGWYVTDTKVNWDGGFTAVDGQAAVLLRRGMLTDSERVEWTMYHEVGHAADQTHLEGGGVFSGQSEFNVRLQNGQIKPMGSVMKAAFDYYNGNPTSDLSKHLSYPFDRAKHGDLDGNGIREELFAQLWATYTTRDGREFLEDNLPEVADFMEQAYEQVKQTDYVAAKADETQRSTQAGGQATQGDGQPRQVPLRQTAVRFRASRPPQGVIDRNIAKLPQMAQQPVKRLTEALGDLGGKTMDYAVFTSELVKRAVAVGLPSAKVFADRLASRSAKVSEEERKIEKIADRYASIEDNAKGDGPGSVNEFLFESTRTNKWGYDTPKIKADPAMKVAFNKLGPKAQQFVKDVFAHSSSTLASKKKIVIDAANSEYDAMIKAAQDALANAPDAKAQKAATAELAKLKAEKAATLKRFQTLFAVREGMPYAPIKRTGNYVVIGESAAYKAAKAKGDTATVKKLESDPDHYHVSFVDTKWQARNLRDNLNEQGVFTDTQFAKRAEAFDEMFSGEAALPALTKMRNAVDARATTPSGAKDPSAGKLLNIISQLYLEALAEGSARKSELRRRGVAGEVDMLQSFTQQGRADANFLASIEFEPQIQEALQQMRTQSRTGDRERKSEIFDELTKRYAGTMDIKQSPFINGLTNLASKFFLASSPGYYMQNLTQPFMMSLPAMAGRHDYVKSSKELFKAYSELGPLFKDVKLFDEQFDFSKVGKTEGEKAAINELVNQGKVDIGLATEINEYKIAADNNLSQFANRLNKGMRLAVQKTEAINRLSTAMAAYRLEFAKTKDAAKATQYAGDILSDTHGDYTAFNAPRAFNTQWGKVALQFRKFQLIQVAFFYKLFRDAFTKPDERAVALKTLSYALGHTAVFAGMMGLPGYAAISFALGLFSDEDEPYDLTADMRKKIGPEWADMIMRGAPTVVGMDLSGKIGAGTMLSIMPFSNADLSTNAGRAEALGTLMGGAALGMTTRMVDGLGLVANGDYYKGIERIMPKGVSDALKAGRQGAEGLTRRNGDVILPDSEISTLDTVFTALGVPAVQQAVTYERQNRMRDLTRNFTERTTRIKNDYAKAVRQKDTAAMAEARAAWTKLQQARQRNGLKPQPISNLLKAPQEQRDRQRRTVGGVSYRQGQQKLAESIAEN